MRKQFKLSFVLFAFMLSVCTPVFAASSLQSFYQNAPILDVESYILIDAKSGTVLAEYKADDKRNPASLTKMMTGYVVGQALREGRIQNSDMVTVSKDAWALGNKALKGSSLMFLEAGKKVSVADLNKGIIIVSGNDACIAMAEHLTGSQARFVDLMNQYVQKLGLTNTHFETVHGLDAPGQYSTARDMAFLGKALIDDIPEEYAIYKQKEFQYNLTKPQLNRNGLLWDKTLNVDGIKTGHTEAAGFNIVASAVDGNTRLISAVLGGRTFKGREAESKKLLLWGFKNFETASLVEENTPLTEHPIWYGQKNSVNLGPNNGLAVTVPKGRAADIKLQYHVDGYIYAPISKGTTVGEINVTLDGKIIAQKPLVTLEDVEKSGYINNVWDWICLQFYKLLNLFK